MIYEKTATAETIEEAQKKAVELLNAPITAEVKIEILEMPKKKTLGLFGGSLAKVRAYYEEEEKIKEIETKEFQEKENHKKTDLPKASKKQIKVEKKSAFNDSKKQITREEAPIEVVETYDYFLGIIRLMGIENPNIIILKRNNNEFYFNIDNEEYHSYIIGRRGETVDALQYLLRLKSSNVSREQDQEKLRIFLNVGDYRQRRENTLIDLAKRSASKAKRYNKNIVLNPMNPYDRRIIHTTVSELEGVSSHSIGHRSQRKVVITPDRNNQYEENQYDKPETESPKKVVSSSKYENDDTSLYGKIEI